MKRTIIAVLCFLLAAAVQAADKLKIVTSIIPLYNITRAITGDRAEVTVMVPPGASPHTFSPKPSQLVALANADIFVLVGAGMEFWAGKMIKAAGNKKLVIIAMTDGQKLIGGDEDEPSGNPHVWLDPVIAKQFAGLLCGELGAKDPADKKYFMENYNKFAAGTDRLDSYFRSEVKKFKTHDLVSFHPAWAYFEKRYGLREVAVIEVVPGREPTPRDMKAIIENVKKYGIKAVFAETTLPRKAADVIAQEAGVKVLVLNPEGGAGDSYDAFMRKNFEIMKEGME
jgi:zinc transport system substrate-binding protein